MKKRNYYTIGFNISLGTILGSLKTQLANISNRIMSMGFKHHFLETIDMLAGEKLIENSDKDTEHNLKEIGEIQKIVDSFNETLRKLNKELLEEMNFFPNLPNLQPIDQETLLLQLKI